MGLQETVLTAVLVYRRAFPLHCIDKPGRHVQEQQNPLQARQPANSAIQDG